MLNSSQENFIREFSSNNWNLNKKFIFQAVASLMPVHIIMFIIMAIFVILIYYISSNNIDFLNLIPKLSALLFAIQKLLPHCQNIYRGYSKIQGQSNLFLKVTTILNKGKGRNLSNKIKNYKFKNSIKFNKVYYSYFKQKKKKIFSIETNFI